MGKAYLLDICLFSILVFRSFVYGGDYCLTDDGTDVIYCDNGCCGNDRDDQYCCVAVTWIIVGSILGAIFIFTVATVVICVCCKMKGKPGRVIQPNGGMSTVTYTTHSNFNQGYYGVQPSAPTAPPPYGFNPQPPPYGQQYANPVPPTNGQHNQFSTQQPNSGNYSNPAFPPPAPAQY